VALTPAAGCVKFRPAGPGSRVALVAPASPFARDDFDRGVAELRRLGFDPVWDERVFDRQAFVAGSAASRAAELQTALTRSDVDAVIAIRGGYGSLHTLGALEPSAIRRQRTAFVGYSDVTSVHAYLGRTIGLASVHGPMIDGRLADGTAAYDAHTFLGSLGTEPLGELSPPGLEVVKPGEALGPLFGGTLTQLTGLLGTPFDGTAPNGHVLFIDEVHERPYRLHRLLTQWRLAGRLASAAGLVFGQLPRCDEPGGGVTAADVVREFAEGFPGPVLLGFPSGHTTTPTTPMLSLPLGVAVRLVARDRPALVFEEAAASA
jgi:muramoyltetrapeptide carboxypeptidase